MSYPDPSKKYPITGMNRTVFLRNIISHSQIEIGDFTYYDDPDDVKNFEQNVLYLFDFTGDRLIIGKFCQIATGVRFIMNGANHSMHGFSTYAFAICGGRWKDVSLSGVNKGNTHIGNDVWIGNGATILPGITIGNGAIIGANSVVTKDVAPYTIVAGNPAKVIRVRFDDETIERLQELAWWDWPIEKITKHVAAIAAGDTSLFEDVA